MSVVATAWRLGVLGAVAAAALAGVDAFTHARIEANEHRVTLRPLVDVTGDARVANLRGPSVPPLTICSASGTPLYRVFVHTASGYSGGIRLLIGLDAANRLTGVRAVSHRETTGIGDAIDTARSSWILRFNGLSADDVALTADGGRIDAISGASVTSRAVVESVRGALAVASSDAAGAPARNCSGVIDE